MAHRSHSRSEDETEIRAGKRTGRQSHQIRQVTPRCFSAEEKISVVLEGLRGEESKAGLCRREGIAESFYYNQSKEFLEARKKRLAGDTTRAASGDEVKGYCHLWTAPVLQEFSFVISIMLRAVICPAFLRDTLGRWPSLSALHRNACRAVDEVRTPDPYQVIEL